MSIQQPSELPQPKATRPDQVFGDYSLEYFIEDNWLYICGVIFILAIVIGYSWYSRVKRRRKQTEN